MATVTIIITILNEEGTLPKLFAALENQSRKPDEVIIVDGGSQDNSLKLLAEWKPSFAFKYLVKKGNRSVGRNLGIARSKGVLIAITDAGCQPQRQWLELIIKPLESGEAQVVAGYYRTKALSVFEQAASTYMLVMPENVDPQNFLPATRSMALTKAIWKKAGGFPAAFSHNEDYVFAHRLKEIGAKMVFTSKAVVSWRPPSTWRLFLKQIGRFAYGDIRAGIFRPKVVSIFLRWMVLIGIGFFRLDIFLLCVALYGLWAYAKNMRHVNSYSGFVILPMMQISSDIVVMAASLFGLAGYIHDSKN